MSNLQNLVDLIEARLAALPDGPSNAGSASAAVAHIDLCASVARNLIDELIRTEGGSVKYGNDNRLRLAGVVTTCTSGPHQLLRNWQTAARRRIAQAGPTPREG